MRDTITKLLMETIRGRVISDTDADYDTPGASMTGMCMISRPAGAVVPCTDAVDVMAGDQRP